MRYESGQHVAERAKPVFALWSPLYVMVERPVNSARYLFLDPTAREMYPDWERIANETVAIVRQTAGADPRDRRLSELVGELSVHSEEFRTRWAWHDVRCHNTGTKRTMHPLAGQLSFNFERFDLAAESGLMMFTYTAEPGRRSAHQESAGSARHHRAREAGGLPRRRDWTLRAMKCGHEYGQDCQRC